MNTHKPVPDCPVATTSSVIGGKWKVVILWHLLNGARRFSELARLIPGASKKMLTQQLRELENDGLLIRSVYAGASLKVEYQLSEEGRTLNDILIAMHLWGIRFDERQKQG